jgi:adenylate kinase
MDLFFDGFPRTAPQAIALDELLEEKSTSISKVIALEVSEEEIVTRILKRGATSGRADDNSEETIRNRFVVYTNQTAPLADYYTAQGKFVSIKGEGDIDAIFNALKSAVLA